MKAKLVVVGAFPKDKAKVFGGFVTVCNALIKSSFPEKFDLVLIDTTQVSNPPPSTKWLKSLINDGINRLELNNKNGVLRLNWTRGESKRRGIDLSNATLHRFIADGRYQLLLDEYQLDNLLHKLPKALAKL